MKDEQLEKYLGKNVLVTFWDKQIEQGILYKGDKNFTGKWTGKGYRLIQNGGTLSFKKSHVIKIKEQQ